MNHKRTELRAFAERGRAKKRNWKTESSMTRNNLLKVVVIHNRAYSEKARDRVYL